MRQAEEVKAHVLLRVLPLPTSISSEGSIQSNRRRIRTSVRCFCGVPGACEMKALTLTQPWATLVSIGAKRVETRSFRVSYRGSLAIHAAKGFPKWAQETCYEQPFLRVLL